MSNSLAGSLERPSTTIGNRASQTWRRFGDKQEDNSTESMETLPYTRWRFTTALPARNLYTASHSWLTEETPGVWRVGLTGFALWLLGDVVEHGFKLASGATVTAGQEIGWIEGLKAVQTIDCAVDGVFLGHSEEIGNEWLYRARGMPASGSLDVHGYAALLDAAVDAVKLAREAECGGECET